MFQCSGHVKKCGLSLQKLTFCPQGRLAVAHNIIVNKIEDWLVEDWLVLPLQNELQCRNDCDQLSDVQQSHVSLKLEPLGAGSLGGPWCRCFCFFCAGGVVVCTLCTASLKGVNLHEGFSNKKYPKNSFFAVGFC